MVSNAQRLLGNELAATLSSMSPGLILKLNELANQNVNKQEVVYRMLSDDREVLAACEAVETADSPRLLPKFSLIVAAAKDVVGKTGRNPARISSFFRDNT